MRGGDLILRLSGTVVAASGPRPVAAAWTFPFGAPTVSLWNTALPQFFDAINLFHDETAAVRSLAPASWATGKSRKRTKLTHGGFSVFAAAADFLAILAGPGIAEALHNLARGDFGPNVETDLRMGVLVGLFFVAMSAMRNGYGIAHYLNVGQLRRSFTPWCTAFGMALVIVLSVKAPAGHVPLPIVTLFVIGFAAVGAARLCLAHGVRARAAQGRVMAKRIFLIGFEAEIEAFTKRFEAHRYGMHIVAAAVLRGQESLAEDLALARAYARVLEPDDVFILVPWSDKVTIEAAINAFLAIPAAIHVGPENVLDRFAHAQIAKIGPISSLNLVGHPLSPSALFIKRLFDLVCASLGLVILAPLFLIVAVAIKLDSPGPVIFRQHRYGFNQQPFRIFKFRSMHSCEDSSKLVQIISKDDARLTRVGAFMRRHNIDELPQLLNVIRGDMSLVGPRPMAVVHDQMFERRIALYARRHNVTPGITGWAQINGCRGGLSEEKIRARVAHDLYYIDHWSLSFDIEILWLTLTSKEAYLDAF